MQHRRSSGVCYGASRWVKPPFAPRSAMLTRTGCRPARQIGRGCSMIHAYSVDAISAPKLSAGSRQSGSFKPLMLTAVGGMETLLLAQQSAFATGSMLCLQCFCLYIGLVFALLKADRAVVVCIAGPYFHPGPQHWLCKTAVPKAHLTRSTMDEFCVMCTMVQP